MEFLSRNKSDPWRRYDIHARPSRMWCVTQWWPCSGITKSFLLGVRCVSPKKGQQQRQKWGWSAFVPIGSMELWFEQNERSSEHFNDLSKRELWCAADEWPSINRSINQPVGPTVETNIRIGSFQHHDNWLTLWRLTRSWWQWWFAHRRPLLAPFVKARSCMSVITSSRISHDIVFANIIELRSVRTAGVTGR